MILALAEHAGHFTRSGGYAFGVLLVLFLAWLWKRT